MELAKTVQVAATLAMALMKGPMNVICAMLNITLLETVMGAVLLANRSLPAQ